jgi:succinyl-diaminopimelate desuccinylase
MSDLKDPAELTRRLIRCPSVTPRDAGAMDVLSSMLVPLGFEVERLPFGDDGRPTIENIYARLGTASPHLSFAGHTDVVPPGDDAAWSADPFQAELRDGIILGRGAVDMKGAIACFVAATARHLETCPEIKGSISLLITGDEEGPAHDGTKRILKWLQDRGEVIDNCLVGEPTNPDRLGDMIKIGRRGSITATIKIRGTQGHVAYPHRADNPIPALVAILDKLITRKLDEGTEHFDPSSLQVTTIDVGNPATNVVPAQASAVFNIRFNDCHTSASLEAWIHDICETHAAGKYDLAIEPNGDAFLTKPDGFTSALADVVQKVTGLKPELSTSGGTSDARFIKDICPVVEFGLVGQTMHKIDESVSVKDLETLTEIYQNLLARYFGAGSTQ